MPSEIKRITFIISSLGGGGAERVVSILANALTTRGYKIAVVLTANDNQAYPLSDQVSIIKLNCMDRYQNMSAPMRVVKRILDIRKTIKENPADTVISFVAETNIDVCLASLGLCTPVIVSERNDPAAEPANRIKQFIRKLVYWRANGFVFQTPDARAFFSRRIQKKSEIILNPMAPRFSEPYIGEREKRIVAVGRLYDQKKYPLLISAFSRFSVLHPEYILEIYGEGPLKAAIEAQIKTCGLEGKVFLKGFSKDVQAQIRTAGFFVMPSAFEGMPNALIEAMSLGLPCISTDCRCGGPRMLIENGKNGLLVPVDHEDALAEAMTKLAEDSAYANALGARAREINQRVDVQMIVDQWLAYIDKVSKKGNSNENQF